MNSPCSEIFCNCESFNPNIFQKNICRDCYHVFSKHGTKIEETTVEVIPVARFIESPKSTRIQRSEKRYPSIRTISEKFRDLSTKEETPEQKIEKNQKLSKITEINKNDNNDSKNTFNNKKTLVSPRVPVKRSITEVTICKKKEQDEKVRLSTTFVENPSIRKMSIKPEPKIPPPNNLPKLPGKSETMKLETVNHVHSELPKPFSTNKKRYAIRPDPNLNYSGLFNSATIDKPLKNKKIENFEESIKIDPRKLKKRSFTQSDGLFIDGNSFTESFIQSYPNKLNRDKRRSSLPLELKLNAIGIEIPPVILQIKLFEPSRETRMIKMIVDESENPSVATLLHNLSKELTSLKSAMETPEENEISSSPSSEFKKKKKFGIIGQFRKKKKDDDVKTPPVTPKAERLARLKDFALYWPAKDTWLDENRQISSYYFRDNTTLEYKRRVRNFKLRVQYEVKLLFSHYGWNKSILISPHVITVSNIRDQIIEWIKEEEYYIEIPIGQRDDKLSLFGIYLNGTLLDDEDKILRTYNIKQKDTLDIKINPGYSFKIKSNNNDISNDIILHEPINGTFSSLIKRIRNSGISVSNDITISLSPPLGNIKNINFEFSRVVFKSNDKFSITSSSNIIIIQIIRVPKDSWITSESRIPQNIILEGEKVIESLITEHVTIFHHVRGKKSNLKYSGTLMISTYRILLERKFQGKETDWMDIPLTSISHISKAKTKEKDLKKYCIDIICKSVRKVTVGFVDCEQRNYNYKCISDIISKHIPSSLFAYSYANESENVKSGWDIYDTKLEYARMGVFSYAEERFGWRLTNLNQDYSLCKSYPKLLAVPATVSDEIIIGTSSFRTKERIPTLVWLHPLTGVCLFRSSQPKVGLQRNTSKHDQQYLYEISMQGTMNQTTTTSKKQLHVFDARPIKAAVGNQVMGAGFESETTGYGFCHSYFLNIDNIHIVRESFTKLQELCISSVEGDTNVFTHWLQELNDTSWIYLLSRILVGAKKIAKLLADEHTPSPCLVHCSDGWDRTSQLSSLAQLLVDPYFRTYHGFQILICKEWLSFGHQIAFRMGHNYGGKEEAEQQAPIFLQFLDCVYQLTVQFPTNFEFNETLLIFLHEEVINCRFGTFLMNCEREREEAKLKYKTKSIWEYLENNQSLYLNPFFVSSPNTVELLLPRCEIPNLTLWNAYYFKYLDFENPPKEAMEKRVRELQEEIAELKKQLANKQ